MKNFIVASDIHAHKYKAFNHGNRRLDNILRLLDELWLLAHDNKADLLIPGDLFNNHQTIHTEVIVRVVESFRNNAAKYPDVVCALISGNHDYATKNFYGNPAISAVAALHGIADNILLIDNTHWRLGGVRVYGLPYYEYREDLEKALTDLSQEAESNEGRNILLMHQVIGFGHELVPDDIDPNHGLFEPFDWVFNGHIHKHSVIGPGFINVGSPIHRDAGDVGQKKGVLLYNYETNGVERIILKGYPQYRHLPEGQPHPPEWDEDYVIIVPEQIEVSLDEKEVQEKFDHHKVPKAELLKNYLEMKELPGGLETDIHVYGNELLSHVEI